MSTTSNTSNATTTNGSKLTVSPSFKGQFTSIMRQRQLFLDAQRRASRIESSSSSLLTLKDSVLTRIFKKVWASISSRFRSPAGIATAATNPSNTDTICLSFSPLAISAIMVMTLGIGIRIGMEIPYQQPGLTMSQSQSQYSFPIPSSYTIPMLRCIPLGLLHLPQYSYHAWNVVTHAVINKLFALHSVVVMGLASTAVSGCLLFALVSPRTSTRSTSEDSCVTESVEPSDSSAADDAKFESVFYEEYDTMMALNSGSAVNVSTSTTGTTGSTGGTAVSGGAIGSESSFSAVNVTTPRCELVITYVPAKGAFGYYTDRKDSLPYTHLETAARIFLVKNARPDLAKLAYVDRRRKTNPSTVDAVSDTGNTTSSSTSASNSVLSAAPAPSEPPASGGGGGIFALFKSYNRKPVLEPSRESLSTDSKSSSAPAPPVTDTHFIYMGSMQDYKQLKRAAEPRTRGSGSSASGDDAPDTAYVNIKYADFKKKSSASASASTRQT
jgi:hypothetical protein